MEYRRQDNRGYLGRIIERNVLSLTLFLSVRVSVQSGICRWSVRVFYSYWSCLTRCICRCGVLVCMCRCVPRCRCVRGCRCRCKWRRWGSPGGHSWKLRCMRGVDRLRYTPTSWARKAKITILIIDIVMFILVVVADTITVAAPRRRISRNANIRNTRSNRVSCWHPPSKIQMFRMY